MATPNIVETSIFGIEVESTEGTFVAPSGATKYFQPEEGGFELTPTRELLERNVMTSSIGNPTPRLGIAGCSGKANVEFRASGTEGADVNYGLFLKAALGNKRSIASTTTTKNAGNTGSVLQIQDADISKFAVGDMVIVKESGGHHPCVITAVDSTGGAANISIVPSKASGSFSNSVVLSKCTTYFTANSGHPAVSLSYYWGNVIRQAAAGCKVKSMSLDGWQTGKLPKWSFGFEGLSLVETAAAAPHTPTYDSGIPPVILQAVVYKDGTAVVLNQFSFSLENKLGFQTSTASPNGKISSRVVERKLKGMINPYTDDTTVDWYTAWVAGTEFALFVKAFIPSSTAGEITMGSCVCIYLPKCFISSYKKGQLEGLLVDDVEFVAGRGSTGSSEEIYIGLI